MKDSISIGVARYTIEKIVDGPNGPLVIHRETVNNVVTAKGKEMILRAASGMTTKLADQMRIGTSGATATSNQTNVLSPIASTLRTVNLTTMDGRTLQLVLSYPSGGTSISANGIAEVAILSENTSDGGSCYSRATFTAVNKTQSDKLKITYEVRIT